MIDEFDVGRLFAQSLAHRFRAARERSAFDIRDLARLAQVDPVLIAAVERADERVDLNEVEKLGAVLGIATPHV